MPLLSLLIPTRNAGPAFRSVLASVTNQDSADAELIVVDSESTDDTVATAREFGAKVISIPASSFNHGETRNLAIRESRGEFCVLLSQDACPANSSFLAEMVAPLAEGAADGVTGVQQPRSDADPMGRWTVEYHNQAIGGEYRVSELADWDRFLQLSFLERLRIAYFDNVCSALRRDVWQRLPFRALPFAEDLDWGLRVLRAGGKLVFNPRAVVRHSHSRPPAHQLRRHYVSGKVVPGLLEMDPHDPGLGDERSFFLKTQRFCRSVEKDLADPLDTALDCAEFQYGERGSLLRRLQAAVSFRQDGGPLARHYQHILGQLKRTPTATKPRPSSLAAQAAAHTLGHFSAQYVNWSEANGGLSGQLKRLDAVLSRGI